MSLLRSRMSMATCGHYSTRTRAAFARVRLLPEWSPRIRQSADWCRTVFVSSRAAQCLDRLENYAGAAPTVVLIELRDDSRDGSSILLAETNADAFPFLRALSADIQGARYQKPVMPFVLFNSETKKPLDAALTTSCLSAGALDVTHSPLDYEDMNRIVAHVKEATRPSARLVGFSMAQNLVDSMRSKAVTRVAAHRPDERVPEERKRAVEEAVGRWHFPAHDFDMEELTYAALYMLEHILAVPELEAYSLPRAELMTFLLATRRQYKHEREVHYHNWRHAVDVTQSLYCFMLDTGLCPPHPHDHRDRKDLNALERVLTPLDGLILLCSAVGHDVGHPGVNNAFLVACNHPLAQMYNDRSVLENYHCAAYSQLLRRHWPALSNIAGFRATMISTILATDMQKHFDYMGELAKLKQKVEGSEPDLGDWSEKDREHARELMMALLMKAADISNVARPFDVSSHWAGILMNEFARQGELESELEIPTCLFGGPPNKEDMLAAAQSQKGFMSLFGFPLFQRMNEIMPSVSCAIRELDSNIQIWDDRIAAEKRRRQSDGKDAPLTFSSVTKDEVEEARSRHHQSDPSAVPEEGVHPPSSPLDRHAVQSQDAIGAHPAQGERHYRAYGVAPTDDKRSSAPYLPAPAFPPSSAHGGSSRRSSKDVALEQLQQLSVFAHQSLSPGSRRGSADAGWQIQQSYPTSRRGSKDESLTTILVTSQGSPGRRSSPSSPSKMPKPGSSPGKQNGKRQSLPHSQKQSAGRNSLPSSRSHATSSATASTMPNAPSTQPSSLAPTDDEPTPPAPHHQSIAATEDPFMAPGSWPNDLDGAHRGSAPEALPATPPLPPARGAKSDSPRILARAMSGEDDESGRGTPRKGERAVRESRSRSRLRGLKFWKKRSPRDATGVEGSVEGGSP